MPCVQGGEGGAQKQVEAGTTGSSKTSEGGNDMSDDQPIYIASCYTDDCLGEDGDRDTLRAALALVGSGCTLEARYEGRVWRVLLDHVTRVWVDAWGETSQGAKLVVWIGGRHVTVKIAKLTEPPTRRAHRTWNSSAVFGSTADNAEIDEGIATAEAQMAGESSRRVDKKRAVEARSTPPPLGGSRRLRP